MSVAALQNRHRTVAQRVAEADWSRIGADLDVAVLLSRPGEDFEGGEFVLTEQRPRRQSRVHVVPIKQGDAVIFAVNERPVQGGRGFYRVKLRHGVSEVRAGSRYTAGIIFHDAE